MANKVEKTRARLQKRIEEGSYYEAHQQLRVLCQRYTKAENYEAAIDIVFGGAQALLKANQGGSGGDLSILMIEVYIAAEEKPSATSKARFFTLLGLLPPEEPSRKKFIKEAVSWSAKFGEYRAGDPELHHVIGSLLVEEGEVYEAERHLFLGTKASADVLAEMLYGCYTEDDPHTAPQYAARGVLPYLLLRNIRDAARVYTLFTKELVDNNSNLIVQEVQSSTTDARIFPSLPLLNFLGLLIVAVQRGGADLFRNLKSHYGTYLKDCPAWDEPLEQVGEIYFGIRIHRPTNLFDMMGSMFGGGGAPSGGLPQLSSPPSADLD